MSAARRPTSSSSGSVPPAGSPRTCSPARGSTCVALEAGPAARPEHDDARRAQKRRARLDVGAEGEPRAADLPRRARRARQSPAPFPTLMVNAIGGTTVHYPGLSIRFQPWNFRSRSAVIERYGTSAIPEGSTLADWPLDYEELEPFYDTVERAIGVAGTAARVGAAIDPEGNAFEGVRARAYPMRAGAADGLDRAHSSSRARARLAPVSCPGGGEHGGLQRQPDVHVLRILLVERVLPRCEGLHRRQRDPLGRGGRPAAHRVGRARDPHRGRRSRPRSGRHVRPGWARALPSDTRRPARCVHVREHATAPPAPRRRPFPRGLVEQSWPSREAFHGSRDALRLRTLPGPAPQPVQRPLGTGDVRRRLERRQLRPRRPGLRRRARCWQRRRRPSRSRPRAAPPPERVPRWGFELEAVAPASTHSRSATSSRNSTASRTRTNGLDLDPTVVDTTAFRSFASHWRCTRTSTVATASCSTGSAAGSSRPARQRPGTAQGRFIEGRHCYGGTRMGDDSRDVRRRPLRVLPRGSESRDHRRIDVPDGRWLQPDAHRPGARLANGATTVGQLERDRGCSVITGARIRPRIE